MSSFVRHVNKLETIVILKVNKSAFWALRNAFSASKLHLHKNHCRELHQRTLRAEGFMGFFLTFSWEGVRRVMTSLGISISIASASNPRHLDASPGVVVLPFSLVLVYDLMKISIFIHNSRVNPLVSFLLSPFWLLNDSSCRDLIKRITNLRVVSHHLWTSWYLFCCSPLSLLLFSRSIW